MKLVYIYDLNLFDKYQTFTGEVWQVIAISKDRQKFTCQNLVSKKVIHDHINMKVEKL